MEKALQLTDEEKLKVFTEGYKDPVYFLRFFLDHLFPSDVPWFHRGIIAILTRKTDFLLKYGELDLIVQHFVYKQDPARDNSPELPLFSVDYDAEGLPIAVHLQVTKYTEFIIPRGFSKTTLIGLGIMLWLIYYQECKFILYVSETAPHAKTQLGNVQDEIQFNPKLNLVFGNLVPGAKSQYIWTKDLWQTTTGISATARGRGGQVRGLNINGQRPDRVLVDDMENEESVATPEHRLKDLSWFYKALKPVLPRNDPTAQILVLGTLLHPECMLMKLASDPDWTTIRFGAIDRNGNPLWAMMMNMQVIEREKLSYASVGQLSAFYMEFLSVIRNDESAKFKERYIIHKAAPSDIVGTAIVIDPAISQKIGADGTAIAVVAMGRGGLIAVQDVWYKVGATPREQVDMYFNMWETWNPQKCGVESIAYQASLIHLLREEMFRRGVYFEIIPITHGGAKDARILGVLQPRYASGYISHSRHFPDLEAQLLEYPGGKKDAPDAVAMAITLLDPYAASAADPNKDLGDDVYEPLSEIFGGDWRSD